MTLKKWGADHISEWEDKLLNSAAELRKIRMGMQEDGIELVIMEADEAIKRIDKILPWAIRCEGRFREQRVQKSVERTRERIKAERKKKS